MQPLSCNAKARHRFCFSGDGVIVKFMSLAVLLWN